MNNLPHNGYTSDPSLNTPNVLNSPIFTNFSPNNPSIDTPNLIGHPNMHIPNYIFTSGNQDFPNPNVNGNYPSVYQIQTSQLQNQNYEANHLPENTYKRKREDSDYNAPIKKKSLSVNIPQKNNTLKAKPIGQFQFDDGVMNNYNLKKNNIDEDYSDEDSEENSMDYDDEYKDIPERKWITVSDNPKNQFNWHVTSKTRSDPERITVPREMYSSLKYQIKTHIKCHDEVRKLYSCLIARCTVVDAEENYVEITKDGKVILDDTHEVALSVGDEGFTGQLKVQFTDCSYHHSSHEFCWQISFFDPKHLEAPLLVIRSGKFRVLARKPKSSKKKKNKGPKKVQGPPQQQQQQLPQPNNELTAFELFEKKLEELVKSTLHFKESEKRDALEMVNKKFGSMFPAN